MCRDHYSKPVSLSLWLLCEAAIVACNMAEVLGMSIGLNLLFGLPMLAGVLVTTLDVILILALQARGFRVLEAVMLGLILLIAVCFAVEIFWLHPALRPVISGFVPKLEILKNPDMLYLAVGIVGATVMPHNLYLHSSLVQTRAAETRFRGKQEAICLSCLDSNIALGFAFFVNAGILILASGAFDQSSHDSITELSDAYQLLSPVLGVGIASAMFGVALVASGLSSSVTGTLAGQIVMEGFLRLRVRRGTRVLLTRLLAIVPAAFATAWYGKAGAGALLVFSQVVLSLQLPFAIVPLLLFTTRRQHLGQYVFGPVTAVTLWSAAGIVVLINLWLLKRVMG